MGATRMKLLRELSQETNWPLFYQIITAGALVLLMVFYNLSR